MATLKEISDLVNGTPELKQRFLAARLKSCWDVINESIGTTNHINRLSWAESILDSYYAHSESEWLQFLSNTTIQTKGDSSTDNDILFVVNSFIDTWSNDLAGV